MFFEFVVMKNGKKVLNGDSRGDACVRLCNRERGKMHVTAFCGT
jgi:hypothetical protein